MKSSNGSSKPRKKAEGTWRGNNNALIRKQKAKHDKKQQVSGLEGLLIEWEREDEKNGWDEQRRDYINHLKSRLRAAKNQLESMCG